MTTFIAQHATALFCIGFAIYTIGLVAIIVMSTDK